MPDTKPAHKETFFGENIREAISVFKEWRNDKMKHKCKCKQSNLLCNHEKIEYCKECGKVHCLKCGREWSDLKETTFSPIWAIPYQPYLTLYPSYPEITWGASGYITVYGGTNGVTNTVNHTDFAHDYKPLLTHDATEQF